MSSRCMHGTNGHYRELLGTASPSVERLSLTGKSSRDLALLEEEEEMCDTAGCVGLRLRRKCWR